MLPSRTRSNCRNGSPDRNAVGGWMNVTTSHPDLLPLTPELFGNAPAREDCFTVVERWADCANLPDGHPDQLLEFLHRQMNEETNVLENAAGSLADFPDAEWDIRLWLARQCSDEARHVLV